MCNQNQIKLLTKGKNMKWKSYILLTTAVLLSISTPEKLFANEEILNPKEESENIVVGSRRLSVQEEVQFQEERWSRANEEGTANEIPFNPEEGLRARGPQQASLGNLVTRDQGAKASIRHISVTHPGAYHYPYAVSPFGDTVELGDGSIWTVKQSDRFLTLDWLTTDTIFVTQNHDFFSTYKYQLINQNTGSDIRVNMTLGPLYNGPMTYFVTGIDYSRRLVWLNDGSRWAISIWDGGALKKWMQNDTVVIGVNTGIGQTFNPHLLINVALNDYIEAENI